MAGFEKHFLDLPNVIHFQVLSYLDYGDLVNCSKTCRDLYEAASEEDLHWRNLYRHFWDETYTLPPNKTWKESFISEYNDKKRYVNFYKKVKTAWTVIKGTMDQLDPEITASLYDGMTEEELDKFEQVNNVTVPDDVRCVYRFHNGQKISEDMNGIFGWVKNYDYTRTEYLMPLNISKLDIGVPGILITGYQNYEVFCLLQDRLPLEAGSLITRSPPSPWSFLVLGNCFLNYFLDYAKKLEEKYFPILDNKVLRFYKDPASVVISYDVKIEVSTAFLPEFLHDWYIHAYHVKFSMDKNVPSEMSCQLESRHWEIIQDGNKSVVDGPGVIGLTPYFRPGSEFSYISCTNSKVSKTSMSGYYTVRNLSSGMKYNIKIPEFHMDIGNIVTFKDL